MEMLIKQMAVHIHDSSFVGGAKAHHISEGMSFTIGTASPERVKLYLPNEKTQGHIEVPDRTGRVLPIEGKIELLNGQIWYTNYNENGVQLIDSDGKVQGAVFRVGAKLLVDPSLRLLLSEVYPVKFEIKDAEITLGEREALPPQAKSEREILGRIMARNYDIDLRGAMKRIDDIHAIIEKERQSGKLGMGIDKDGVSVKGMWSGEDGVAHLPKEGEAIIVGKPDYLENVLLKVHFVNKALKGEKVYLLLTGGCVEKLGNVENKETQNLLGFVLGLKKEEFTNNIVILSERSAEEIVQSPEKTGVIYGEEGAKIIHEKYRKLFGQMPVALRMENGILITSEGAENIAKDISEVIKPVGKNPYAVVDLSKGSDDPNQVQINYL